MGQCPQHRQTPVSLRCATALAVGVTQPQRLFPISAPGGIACSVPRCSSISIRTRWSGYRRRGRGNEGRDAKLLVHPEQYSGNSEADYEICEDQLVGAGPGFPRTGILRSFSQPTRRMLLKQLSIVCLPHRAIASGGEGVGWMLRAIRIQWGTMKITGSSMLGGIAIM